MRLLCSPLKIGFSTDQVCFSPDGRFLIAADTYRSPVRIFDTKSWAHSITLDSGPSGAVAFAREQPLLATDGWGQITLWDTTSWKPTDALPSKGEISHLAISPDGTKLVRSVKISRQNWLADRIELWDLSERRVIRTLTGRKVIDQIAFSPDGELLAIGDLDGAVHIWTVAELFAEESDPPPTQIFSASHPIESLAFSPDAARLAVGTSKNNAVLVWDLASQDNQPLATIRGHAFKVSDVAFVGDANTVCSCGFDGYLKMWDLSQCRPYDTIDRADSRSQVGYAKDGTLIYQDDEGTIQRWDTTTRESRATLDSEQKYSRIAISTDGSVLAGVTHDEEQLLVWDLADGRKLHRGSLEGLRRHNASHEGGVLGDVNISRLIVSNDGRLAACQVPWRGSHGPVVLVDSDSGNVIGDAHELSWMEAWPAFSPYGRHIVTQGYLDSFSRLSDITPDSLEQPLRIQGRGLERCAAFSPDGKTLAIGSYNHDIRLHDVDSGELVQTLKGHTDALRSLAFWPHHNRLVSAGLDGTVRIWKGERNEYRLASTLRGHSDAIKQVAVSPRGDSLAALFGDGTVRVWRSAIPQEVAEDVDAQLIRAGGDLRIHPDKALRALDAVLARAPQNLRALTLRGRVHAGRGDWESAVAAWTTAIDLAPGNHYFLESRAKARAAGRQWAESLADWNQLVQLTSESNGEYLLGRGECYLHMGRLDDARADFAKALTSTANMDSIQRIISLLGFAKLVVPTGTHWRFVTGPEPPQDWETTSFDDSDWRTGWAPFGSGQRGLSTRTDWEDRDIWLRHTVELDHEIDGPLVLHLLADDDVEVFLNGVPAATTGNTVNYQKHVEYRNVYPVVKCSSQARLRPGQNVLAVHCQYLDWRLYVDVGLYEQAERADIEATLIAATERAPKNAVLHTALAERYVEQGIWKDAAVHFHKSAELSPGRGVIWMWAALMYCRSGDMDRYHRLTADILKRFGEVNSPDRAVWLAKACLVAEPTEANLPGLVKLVDRALTLDPRDHNIPAAQMVKALAEYRSGHDQAAIEWAQKCQALSVLALAHARTGAIELARQEMAELNQIILHNTAPFHTVVKSREPAHEWAFSQMLLDEVKQKVTTE